MDPPGSTEKKMQKTTIMSLPRETMAEIMGCVAKESTRDLASMKLCCKHFNESSKSGCVFKQASLENFPLVPTRMSNAKTAFLKLCEENQNAEALYRKGMQEFLASTAQDSNAWNLDNLKFAANEGHVEARYVYSMILLCRGSIYSADGNKFLHYRQGNVRNGSASMNKCRSNVRRFIHSAQVSKRVVRFFGSQVNSVKRVCCANCKMFIGKNYAVPNEMKYINDNAGVPIEMEDINDIVCHFNWDHEIATFYTGLLNASILC